MRIAFISCNEYSLSGGSEDLWSKAALRLVAEKNDVAVNVVKWTTIPEHINNLIKSGAHMYWRKRMQPVEKIKTYLPFTDQNKYRWLLSYKPDLVVISQGKPMDGVDCMQYCLEKNIPYMVVVQLVAEKWWNIYPFLEKKCRKVYEKAKKVFFISRQNLSLLKRQLKSDLKNSFITRNPFNVPYDPCISWPEDFATLRMAFVGRLEMSHKGLDILFKILQSKKWKKRPIHISIYGDGPDREKLKKIKIKKKLDNIYFNGFTDNIFDIWKENHLLLLPSYHEAGPIVAVEAMLCGRPCIATNIGMIPELIEDNINGFIAKKPTVKHFDDAMERAWRQRNLLKEIGTLSIKAVKKIVPSDPVDKFLYRIKDL